MAHRPPFFLVHACDRERTRSARLPRSSAQARGPWVVWNGTYTSSPGSLYVYDGGEWKGSISAVTTRPSALARGPLSLTLDPASPTVHGTGGGALGDVVLSGASDAKTGEVTFTLNRKDTTDRGFTGTGVGHLSGNTLTGTMRLSRGDAHVIREATFTLNATP